jgi:hypothetical protein
VTVSQQQRVQLPPSTTLTKTAAGNNPVVVDLSDEDEDQPAAAQKQIKKGPLRLIPANQLQQVRQQQMAMGGTTFQNQNRVIVSTAGGQAPPPGTLLMANGQQLIPVSGDEIKVAFFGCLREQKNCGTEPKFHTDPRFVYLFHFNITAHAKHVNIFQVNGVGHRIILNNQLVSPVAAQRAAALAHPAALPPMPSSQPNANGWRSLPPKPTLKISKLKSGKSSILFF